MLRGDGPTGALLLEYGGRALIEEGIRTPVDVVLHSHYTEKLRGTIDDETVDRNRERAAEMTLADAIACGLHTPS